MLSRAGTKHCIADDCQVVNKGVSLFIFAQNGAQVKTKPLLPTKSSFCVAVYLIAMYCGIYHDIYPDIYRDTTPQHCLSLDNEVICDAHRRLNPCLGEKKNIINS